MSSRTPINATVVPPKEHVSWCDLVDAGDPSMGTPAKKGSKITPVKKDSKIISGSRSPNKTQKQQSKPKAKPKAKTNPGNSKTKKPRSFKRPSAMGIESSTALDGFYNDTSSTKEVVVRATDYFELKSVVDNEDNRFTGYSQYLFDVLNNSLFPEPGTGSTANLVRVIRATFSALPRFSPSQNTIAGSLIGVAFGVPATTSDGANSTVCQRTTILTPSAVSDWEVVGVYDQEAFSNSQVLPCFDQGKLLCLGTMCTLDPDTFQLYPDSPDVILQMKVVIEYAVTLPNVSSIQGVVSVSKSPSAWQQVDNDDTTGVAPVPEALRAMVQALRISNMQ